MNIILNEVFWAFSLEIDVLQNGPLVLVSGTVGSKLENLYQYPCDEDESKDRGYHLHVVNATGKCHETNSISAAALLNFCYSSTFLHASRQSSTQ